MEYNHLLHNISVFNATLQENYDKLQASNQFNLMIYGLLILALVIFCATKTVQYYLVCMTASKNLHNEMFAKLLRAQPRFFDVNPSGRILNRFSKDMGSMDEVLPASMLDVKWVIFFCFIPSIPFSTLYCINWKHHWNYKSLKKTIS